MRAEIEALYKRLPSMPELPFNLARRTEALDRFAAEHSGREKPGRFWRIDFESLVPNASAIELGPACARVEAHDSGIVVCPLATAARESPALLDRALGRTRVARTKFGALNAAFAHLGFFIHARADRACDDPVVITYEAPPGAVIFPTTVLFAERGARITVIERIEGGEGAFICGATEIVTEERSEIRYAVAGRAGAGARVLWDRAALPGRDARIALADAELGGALCAGELSVEIGEPGAAAEIAALFFPTATQHVDVVSTVDHRAGDSTSETLVKSAARERGQARFLGNIRIAPHAQGSDARLRDDALLLSPTAHVDSVPALEIAANDVKAYHGATVGAIDAEQIFYMESRGIERDAAERMIALGFFEPVLDRFPTQRLRDELRDALAEKL